MQAHSHTHACKYMYFYLSEGDGIRNDKEPSNSLVITMINYFGLLLMITKSLTIGYFLSYGIKLLARGVI